MSLIRRPRTGPWTSQPAKSTIAWSVLGNATAGTIDLLQTGSPLPVGLYEVSLWLTIDLVATSGTIRFQADCNDTTGNVIYSLPAQDASIRGSTGGIFLVMSNGVTTLTGTFVFAGMVGIPQYSWRCVVNQLDDQS